MNKIQHSDGAVDAGSTGTHDLRRIAIMAGFVLLILILIAVAIYAVAFLILAPMMA